MNKPLLTLTSKDWLNGVNASAHTGKGGVLWKAQGVSALRGLGFFGESNIGLLQTSPTGTEGGSGVIADAPIYGAADTDTSLTYSVLYLLGDAGHIYLTTSLDNTPTDLGVTTQIASPSNGMEVFQAVGGTKYLYYWQHQQIGRVTLATSPVPARTANSTTGAAGDSWKDNWSTGLKNITKHPTHKFVGNIYYGNDYLLGSIYDNLGGDATNSLNVLDFPQTLSITALEDDGTYLAIAVSADRLGLSNTDSRIMFWDTFSSSWIREFTIPDPMISDMKRVGNVLYAIGNRGIYQVAFTGIQKIWNTGNSAFASADGPGWLSSYNNALLIGTPGQVALLGAPQPGLPVSYHIPIVPDSLGAGNYATSYVNGEFRSGAVIVADASPESKVYQFDDATRATGLSAQTVYFELPYETQITRIEVVFGVPLASGDAFNIQTKLSESDSAVTFDSTSFATDGAIRRKVFTPTLNPTPRANAQISFILNWTGGAVKIKSIHIFGEYEIGKTE